jgi:RNA polymerase sigma-70 factor (ECF subfamily)
MRRYEQRVYNYLFVLLSDEQSALDCTQDTFLRAHKNLRRGKPVTATWLYRVARNLAMDLFRTRARMVEEPLSDSAADAGAWAPPSGDEDVRHALSLLPAADRELLYLAHVDRLRAREIADLLGAREGTVRMRLLRAHRRFIAVYEGTL